MIGGGRHLTWLSLWLRPMGLEIIHYCCQLPLQYYNSASMPYELLDLGCFVLDKLELFMYEEAHTLSHHLKIWCGMKLVILLVDDPKLFVENCLYLGGTTLYLVAGKLLLLLSCGGCFRAS